jgi:hypothetical protein
VGITLKLACTGMLVAKDHVGPTRLLIPSVAVMLQLLSDIPARLDKVWLDLHKEYLKLSTDSSLVLAEHSGYFIQQTEPQLVIDAILKLVDKARQQ